MTVTLGQMVSGVHVECEDNPAQALSKLAKAQLIVVDDDFDLPDGNWNEHNVIFLQEASRPAKPQAFHKPFLPEELAGIVKDHLEAKS